jgi:hypothetical protein
MSWISRRKFHCTICSINTISEQQRESRSVTGKNMGGNILTYLAVALFLTSSVTTIESSADTNIQPRLSPDEVENRITLDRETNPLYESKLLAPVHVWKNRVSEQTGFNWSLDYSALFLGVSDSPGEDQASGGMVRFFGYWDLVNRGDPNRAV